MRASAGPHRRRIDGEEEIEVEQVVAVRVAHERRGDVDGREPVAVDRPVGGLRVEADPRVDALGDHRGEGVEQACAAVRVGRAQHDVEHLLGRHERLHQVGVKPARSRGRGASHVGRHHRHVALAQRARVLREDLGIAVELGLVAEERQALDGERRARGRPAHHERDLAVAEHPQPLRGALANRALDHGVELREVEVGVLHCGRCHCHLLSPVAPSTPAFAMLRAAVRRGDRHASAQRRGFSRICNAPATGRGRSSASPRTTGAPRCRALKPPAPERPPPPPLERGARSSTPARTTRPTSTPPPAGSSGPPSTGSSPAARPSSSTTTTSASGTPTSWTSSSESGSSPRC